MPQPRVITEARQLLVEGRDAEVFFSALIRSMGMTGLQVQDFGSIYELQAFLKAFRIAPGFAATVTSLGIVRDAESDPRAAFNSVRSALRNAGLPTPARPGAAAEGSPRVNVLILPDANSPGMLETLCLQAVVADPVLPCVDSFFACMEEKTGSLPINMEKARAHAFLASRPKPDLLIGQAANAGYWPWGDPAFDHVKRFLLDL